MITCSGEQIHPCDTRNGTMSRRTFVLRAGVAALGVGLGSHASRARAETRSSIQESYRALVESVADSPFTCFGPDQVESVVQTGGVGSGPALLAAQLNDRIGYVAVERSQRLATLRQAISSRSASGDGPPVAGMLLDLLYEIQHPYFVPEDPRQPASMVI